jgi:hypothetical protein
VAAPKKELGGVGSAAWKKRYYVMKDDSLLVFERPRDPEPRKQISLRGAKIVRSANKAKFEFSLTTPKRRYLFRASFDDELDEWIQALNSGIQYATTRTITSNGPKVVQRPIYARHADGSNPEHHNGDHF